MTLQRAKVQGRSIKAEVRVSVSLGDVIPALDAPPFAPQRLEHPTYQGRMAGLPAAWQELLAPLYLSSSALSIVHITTGGSDRSFYRVADGQQTHVACVTPNRFEFHNYLAIGAFLRRSGLPLPEIVSWCADSGLALLEDAGSMPLQAVALRYGPEAHETLEAYRQVLAVLGHLQEVPAERCREMASRPFSHADLRWETTYFCENFCGRHLGWDLTGDALLHRELERLAQQVLGVPPCAMHRDFQSQNVQLEAGRVWLLDFQGARVGPLPYDVASLLRDPYVHLPVAVEDSLLRWYYEHALPPSALCGSFEAFRHSYALVSLQRLMQALGAYGFLTLVKGKPWFEQWKSPALELLARAVGEVEGYPRLREVVEEAQARHAALASG
jgi:N-acetylmuramate 1-kinase